MCIVPRWSSPFTARDLHCYWHGSYNEFAQNLPVAYQWHQKVLANKQCPGYMYKGLLHLLQKTNKNNLIISLMPSIEPSFIHDTETQLLFAQALQQMGRQDDADQKFIRLLDKAKDNQQVAFQAAQVFWRRKEPENALLTIQDYLITTPGNPSNFMFYFLEAQIYLSANKHLEARTSLEKSLELQPNFDNAWLMLLQLAFKQKLLEAQEQHLHINPSCFDRALSLLKGQKYKEALQTIDECLMQQQQKDMDNKILKTKTNIFDVHDVTHIAFIQATQHYYLGIMMHFKHMAHQIVNEQLVLKYLTKCYSTYSKQDANVRHWTERYLYT
jgi:tetratricopeptide (TPR) repeat protein